MSSRSDRKRDKAHPAVANAKLDAEVWRDPRDRLSDAVWVFWHRPYFEACSENSPRGQNQRMRGYLSRYLDDADVSNEVSDSHLGRIGLKKGCIVIKLKLEAGDVERAEVLAKETGLSFDECIKIYSDINIMNTPSYQGGELIQKAGGLPPSALVALRELDLASENHAAAKRAHGNSLMPARAGALPSGPLDPYVTKANLDRATTQCQLELVKAARSRPIAYGDLGVINLMRQGRP